MRLGLPHTCVISYLDTAAGAVGFAKAEDTKVDAIERAERDDMNDGRRQHGKQQQAERGK